MDRTSSGVFQRVYGRHHYIRTRGNILHYQRFRLHEFDRSIGADCILVTSRLHRLQPCDRLHISSCIKMTVRVCEVAIELPFGSRMLTPNDHSVGQ